MAGNTGGTVGAQLAEILDDYEQEVQEAAAKVINKTAKDTAKMIKDASPRSNSGGAHYADGWTTKADSNGGIIVYNRLKPQLTHLLENGHAKRNGGRVAGQEHIAPAEAWAENALPARIEEELK